MSQARTANRQQNFLLPPSIEEWVRHDDPVRFIADVVDSLELLALGFNDPPADARGRPPYSAKMLLGVWLYGYFRRIRSTRQLAVACAERMPLLWLTGMHYPDHTVLWRFFDVHREALRALFKTVVRLALRQGLVGMVAHALDGTKIQAACSTVKALHKPQLEEQLEPLVNDAVDAAMAQVQQSEETPTAALTLSADMADAVKRRQAIEQGLAQLAATNTKHLSPADPSARMMKVNATLRMAHNAQLVADENQFIVAESVVSDEADAAQALPMLQQAEAVTQTRPEVTLMDSGYVSSEALAAVQSAGHTVIVPPSTFAPSQEAQSNPYDRSHFRYDAEQDVFVCPEGELLPLSRLTRTRNEPTLAVYRCRNKACPKRAQCTRDRAGRTVRRSPADGSLRKQRELQEQPQHAGLYPRRQAIIEPVFAQLKVNDGFRRFTVRGAAKVRTQWSLLCTAYNLRKLYAHWRSGRLTLGA